MTREEEIQKLIDEEMGIDNYGSCDFQAGVRHGVKLADKTMIEKVCEWLSEIDFDSDYFRDAEDCFDNDKIIEEIKKAMEE